MTQPLPDLGALTSDSAPSTDPRSVMTTSVDGIAANAPGRGQDVRRGEAAGDEGRGADGSSRQPPTVVSSTMLSDPADTVGEFVDASTTSSGITSPSPFPGYQGRTGVPGISFTAIGEPQTQGSLKTLVTKSGFRRTIHDNAPVLKPWRSIVAAEAADAMGGQPVWDCAVVVQIVFVFPVGSSMPKSWRTSEKWFRPWRGKDIDKCARAVLDSLTGVVFKDDSRVVALCASKWWVGDEDTLPYPCATVVCSQVHPEVMP